MIRSASAFLTSPRTALRSSAAPVEKWSSRIRAVLVPGTIVQVTGWSGTSARTIVRSHGTAVTNPFGNVDINYAGTVHFTSTDTAAVPRDTRIRAPRGVTSSTTPRMRCSA